MTKPTFVKKFAARLRKIHNRPVDIRGDVGKVEQVGDLTLQTADDEKVFLVPKNGTNGELFEDSSEICILIHDGRACRIGRNCNPQHALKIYSECQLCYEDILEKCNGRYCSNCGMAFCIKCQIKLIIDRIKLELFELKCPFCTYVEPIETPDNLSRP